MYVCHANTLYTGAVELHRTNYFKHIAVDDVVFNGTQPLRGKSHMCECVCVC